MCSPLSAAVVIPGDLTNQATSFSFPVFAHAYDVHNQVLFLGSQAAAGGVNQVKEFAISVLPQQGTQCIPLAPQTVMLNFKQDQTNPLYDAGIAFLGLVYGDPTKGHGHPVVVTTSQPGSLCFYYDINSASLSLMQFLQVGDAAGLATSGIVGLSAYSQSYVMLGVKPNSNASVFGDIGSGLSLFILGAITQGEGLNTQNWRGFFPLDAVSGAVIISGLGKAAPFDRTQPVLAIGDPLTSLGSVIDIHYDEFLQRFYIAVQLQAGPGATDGGKAVVVAYVQNQVLKLVSIAPDAAFDAGQDQIVGSIGANAFTSIAKVRTLHTSTNLSYLLTVGGNGDTASTAQMVYALPLVNGVVSTEQFGTLANKNAAPSLTTNPKIPYQVYYRSLNVPAAVPADMTRATDPAAVVGGMAVPSGPISDIYVRGDTVFVAVGMTANPAQLPGIYYSQALFDNTGKIKDWTLWQRAAGTTAATFGAVMEPQVGNFIYMTGATQDTVNTINSTLWGVGSDNMSAQLVRQLGTVLEPSNGGIEQLVDKQDSAPGLANISLLLAMGGSTIALAQTGNVVSGVLHPTATDWPIVSFEDGIINQTLPISVDTPIIVSITGGVLSDIQKLVAAEVATNGAANTMGWLFAGGTHGVAVLSDDAGNGWNTATGLGPNFVGLQAGMSFKQFGSYKFVRKIVYDSNYLYILTDTQLDRIDLSQANPGLGEFTPVTIATNTQLVAGTGSFSDCMISGPFALLGTTSGLLRVGNGADIRTALSTQEVGWQFTPPVEGTQAVYQIVPFTKTGKSSDATNPLFNGANVYVLNTYAGKERAQITRFTIAPVTDGIRDTTIQVIPDMYVNNIPSFLMNFGSLRTRFMTDGALFMAARDRIRTENPVVTVPVPSRLPQSGYTGKEIGIPQHQTSLPLDISTYEHVSALLRLYASGSWLISGDFGLRINE